MKSKRPRTQKQAAAARANGAKSKGPKTEEGKAVSRLNALKHGGYATREHVLINELPEVLDELRASFYEKFQPSGEVEGGLVEEMAYAHWRMRRFWFAQDAAVSIQMLHQDEENAQLFENITEPARVARAMTKLVDDSKALEFMYRSEARFRRQYSRALNDLLKLQSLRPPQSLPIPTEQKSDATNPAHTQPPTSQPLAPPFMAHFRSPSPIRVQSR